MAKCIAFIYILTVERVHLHSGKCQELCIEFMFAKIDFLSINRFILFWNYISSCPNLI
jgi:hypothetical protein